MRACLFLNSLVSILQLPDSPTQCVITMIYHQKIVRGLRPSHHHEGKIIREKIRLLPFHRSKDNIENCGRSSSRPNSYECAYFLTAEKSPREHHIPHRLMSKQHTRMCAPKKFFLSVIRSNQNLSCPRTNIGTSTHAGTS